MKITIIGAAGVRTPLIVQAIQKRKERLGLDELALMDIDGERLELIGVLSSQPQISTPSPLHITYTTDPVTALSGADFVITTFRVGGIESRIVDERVPLNHGVLGQETTGAGGFAMGLRSIPILIEYVQLMQKVCPHAWLINFANPAGMLTEAVVRNTDWERVIGICDGPTSMHNIIAAILQAKPEQVYLDYFGLNHLGWIKRVMYQNEDRLPDLLTWVKSIGSVPGLPFDVNFILSLGMIPNEYLYYYYCNSQAVRNILQSSECRGEQVARQNLELFARLREKHANHDQVGMQVAYQVYLDGRSATYMQRETGKSHDLSTLDPKIIESINDEGYAGVALNLIEALVGEKPMVQILNVPNRGAISSMEEEDVVEIPAVVSRDRFQPKIVNDIPSHCMGLMLQVKDYEHLTIQAAVEKSYEKALLALTLHPLVRDYSTSRAILDDYTLKHKGYFPVLE